MNKKRRRRYLRALTEETEVAARMRTRRRLRRARTMTVARIDRENRTVTYQVED